jgi:transcription elongation factor GreA
MKETLLTPDGLERARDELERLKTAGRQALAERIRQAVSTDADTIASADFLAVREEQALLESRIARLEQRLSAVRVVAPDAGNEIVDLGERVRLRNLETGARQEYELVASLEVDPAAGRISVESPLGLALLGRRCGEVAVVDAPRGRARYQILAIEAAGVAA